MKWRTALRPSDCGRILIRFEEFHSDEQRHGRLERTRTPRGEMEGEGGGVEGNGRCQEGVSIPSIEVQELRLRPAP